MKTLKIINQNTNIQFLKYKKITLSISIIFCLISFFSLFINGLNFGIDFKGGSLIEVKSDESINISDVRSKLSLLNLGDVQIQNFGSEKNILVRVESSSSENNSSILSMITNELETFGEIQRTEVVGPKISSELIQKGILAIISAVGLMLFYIWIRFEWQFSLGAVLALVHDVIITIGIFSFFQIEFNLSIIAALLTIIGYSMNDTVVVYDRIRENLRKYKKQDLYDLINSSINQTLSRTVLTSFTTLLALFSLYIFGGQVIKGFTLAMIIGVFIGTYSSTFIASQLLHILGVKRDWSKNNDN
ncbi:MAG: protein translocase subunit SecF [Rhizobiales bacterium TMED94]|nr:protein translocase subunit SecF [Rhodobiaceae bacterium]RPF86618.1 MAG: protein translocase subunit SecF [Rhizobiales bacterium TMED94]|tara:strand:+ start:951 stop:1859 length:909 start_codon:yes stop_codon:yes gene_type:complete